MAESREEIAIGVFNAQSKDPIVDIDQCKSENGFKDSVKSGGYDKDNGVEHPTSYAETLTHLFRGNVGSGLYAMGDAFKNAGIIFGTVVTFFLAVISVHSQHLLLTASEKVQNKLKLSAPPDYASTVHLVFATGPERLHAYAKFMRVLVDIFLCVTQLGFCCVYFVFVSTNLNKILLHIDVDMDIHIIMVIIFLPILGTCLVRNLKHLSPFSSFANLLMIVGVGITLYFASTDLPSISTRRYMADWNRIPLYFGTTIYAFEGIGLVLPLKNEMANPKYFQRSFGVLNIGMTVVTFLLVAVGLLGYLKWGEDVQGSLTLNLPPDNVLSVVVQGILAVAIIFTFPIQFYVPVDIIWSNIKDKVTCFKHKATGEIILRILLVILTFLLAEAIPKLGLFISLVGAVSSTALALLFPPVLELVSRSQDPEGIPLLVILKNAFIIILGLIGFVTGTYESINSIIDAFSK